MMELVTPTLNAGFGKLLQRLQAQSSITLLDEPGFEAFVAASGDGVMLFAEEPDRQPETWDVAVILPEVLKSFPALRAAILPPELARTLQTRYGVTRWPALVFVRDGGYVGAIEGMRNWDEYLKEIVTMLQRPVGRIPGIGIPVMHTAPGCH
jgi:hydrogenase-1 operon protein HyaE